MPSERHTDKFLKLTVCEKLNVSYAYKTLKENGRSNYFIMYVSNGCCTLIENGQELKAEAGSLILYRPGERQEYFFEENSGSVIYYALFVGTACEEIICEAGLYKRITAVGTSKKPSLCFQSWLMNSTPKSRFGGNTPRLYYLNFSLT